MQSDDALKLVKVNIILFNDNNELKKSLIVKIFLNFFEAYKEVHQVADITTTVVVLKMKAINQINMLRLLIFMKCQCNVKVNQNQLARKTFEELQKSFLQSLKQTCLLKMNLMTKKNLKISVIPGSEMK